MRYEENGSNETKVGGKAVEEDRMRDGVKGC